MKEIYIKMEKEKIPSINSIIDEMMSCSEKDKIGMIASHVGIVRGYSLNGKKVKGLSISFDRGVIERIVKEIRSRQGIVEVDVRLNEGDLEVGDWIMLVMVAGETRDRVFPALMDMVDMIKRDAAKKKEIT